MIRPGSILRRKITEISNGLPGSLSMLEERRTEVVHPVRKYSEVRDAVNCPRRRCLQILPHDLLPQLDIDRRKKLRGKRGSPLLRIHCGEMSIARPLVLP